MGYTHRKGYWFEKKMAEAFQVVWPECERAHASRKKGDLVGTGKFHIECKNRETLQPGSYIKKLEGIHPEGNWILLMRGGKSAKYFGNIAVVPLGPHPRGVHGYNLFRLTDFLSPTALGFVPEIVTYQGRQYFVQTVDACIAHLKQSKGERCIPQKLHDYQPVGPLS